MAMSSEFRIIYLVIKYETSQQTRYFEIHVPLKAFHEQLHLISNV